MFELAVHVIALHFIQPAVTRTTILRRVLSQLLRTAKCLASGPFGYYNQSGAFDKARGEWVAEPSANAILVTAVTVVDEVYSYEHTGLVTLHGMLAHVRLTKWTTKLLVNHHPSMMVVSFIRKTFFFIS